MDDYYDKLPFVLDREQYEQEFLVLGTGLLECLLAAHLTKMQQRKGIVIDTEKTYGSTMKTLSLREFHEAMSSQHQDTESKLPIKLLLTENQLQRNAEWYEQKRTANKFRGYSIDLQPRFFFGSSATCQLMKDADMDKYMDFRVVSNILFLHDGKLQKVPLSKGTIFESKALSLFEKRQLLKTLHTMMSLHSHHREIESDVNSTNEFDKDHETDEALLAEFKASKDQFCLPFLKKVCNNNEKIIKMLAYVILGYGYDLTSKVPEHARHDYTVESMVDRFGRFVRSCGIYAETPYLYVDNGIGDIPQAYSRIASIFGTVFILHPRVELQSIAKQQNGFHIKTNLCPEGDLVAKELFIGLPFVPMVYEKLEQKIVQTNELVLRTILICKKNALVGSYSCPALCHLYDLKEELLPNPVTMMIFDNTSSSCPQEEVVLALETIVPEQTNSEVAADRLVALASKLLNPDNQPDFLLYTTKFCQTNSYFQNDKQILQGGNWAVDLDPIFNAFQQRIGPATNYFRNEAHQPQEEEQEEDYYVNLIGQLDKVKQTTEKKQEQVKQEVEKETPERQGKEQEQPIETGSSEPSPASQQAPLSDQAHEQKVQTSQEAPAPEAPPSQKP